MFFPFSLSLFSSFFSRLSSHSEFDELVSFVLSEMKRTALVHGFEDAVRQELARSKRQGALSATLLTAPTRIELKRKLMEVTKEMEEGMGHFVDVEKRIAQIIDSGWMRDHVDDSIVIAFSFFLFFCLVFVVLLMACSIERRVN